MKFLVTTPVISVHGDQSWTVDAENEEEAIAKVVGGGGEFHSEQIDVQSLDYRNSIAEPFE